MITLRKSSVSRLLILAISVCFAHGANALSITQSFNVENVGGSNLSLTLNPFDASLGTLTSVIMNFSAPSRLLTDQYDCPVSNLSCGVRGFASLDWFTGDVFTSKRYTSDNTNTFVPGESKSLQVSMTPYWSYNPSHDLSSFSVNSPRLVAYDEWRCGTCTNKIGSGTQTLSGSLVYVFTPVPVPATFALVVLGLLGLGVFHRGVVYARS